MYCSQPGSSGHGIPQANAGVGCHSPGDLPDPGTEPGSPALQADPSSSEPPAKPNQQHKCV